MKKFITNRQICLILYCVISGYGVIDLPKIIVDTTGTDGWITIIISAIISAIITYIIAYLQYTFAGKVFKEYTCNLVGKYITYMFCTIYAIYFFLLFVLVIRFHCETINLTILTKTPPKYMALLVYIITAYAIFKGLSCIARVCEIYGIINIIGMILIVILLISYGKLVNLRPLFIQRNLSEYIEAISKITSAFLGMEILMTIPFNKDKNKNIEKHSVITICLLGAMYIFIVESVIAVGGISLVKNSNAVLVTITSGVDIAKLELLRRPDFIFIIIWVMKLICVSSVWGYGTVVFISKIFENIKQTYIIIIMSVVSFATLYIPIRLREMKMMLEYILKFGLIITFIIPIILLIITKVKKYDKKIS